MPALLPEEGDDQQDIQRSRQRQSIYDREKGPPSTIGRPFLVEC